MSPPRTRQRLFDLQFMELIEPSAVKFKDFVHSLRLIKSRVGDAIPFIGPRKLTRNDQQPRPVGRTFPSRFCPTKTNILQFGLNHSSASMPKLKKHSVHAIGPTNSLCLLFINSSFGEGQRQHHEFARNSVIEQEASRTATPVGQDRQSIVRHHRRSILCRKWRQETIAENVSRRRVWLSRNPTTRGGGGGGPRGRRVGSYAHRRSSRCGSSRYRAGSERGGGGRAEKGGSSG